MDRALAVQAGSVPADLQDVSCVFDMARLSEPLLREILVHMSFASRCRLARVSRRFMAACYHPMLWREVDLTQGRNLSNACVFAS